MKALLITGCLTMLAFVSDCAGQHLITSAGENQSINENEFRYADPGPQDNRTNPNPWNHEKLISKLIRTNLMLAGKYLAGNKYDSAIRAAQSGLLLTNYFPYHGSNGCLPEKYFLTKKIAEARLKQNQLCAALDVYLDCYEQLITCRQNLSDTFGHEQYVLHLYIANIYENLLDYDHALEFYEKGLHFTKEHIGEYNAGLSTFYYHLGRIYHDFGDLDEALNYYEKALQGYEGMWTDNLEKIAFIYNNIGIICQDKGEMQKALSRYMMSHEVFEKILDKDDFHFSVIFNNLAEWHREAGNFEDAVDYYNKSLVLKKKYEGEGSNSAAFIYNNLGLLYFSRDSLEKALELHNMALKIRSRNYPGHHPVTGQSLYNMALVYLKLGEYDVSIQLLQQALVNDIEGFHDLNYRVNPDISGKIFPGLDIYYMLNKKAEAVYEKYKKEGNVADLRLALKTMELAFDLNDIISNNFEKEGSRYIRSEKTRNHLENALCMAFDLYQQGDTDIRNEIFRLFEKSKAVTLVSSISEMKARINCNIPDSLLNEARGIRNRMAACRTFINGNDNAVDPGAYDKTRHVLSELEERYGGLMKYIELQFPEYADLKVMQQVPDIARLQACLDKNTALIEYFVGNDCLYTMMVTRENFKFLRMPTGGDLGKLVTELLSSIKFFRKDFPGPGLDLYRLLVEPLEPYFSGKENLVFIPDDLLLYIPYEALNTGINTDGGSANVEYLVRKYNISYHYSGILWMEGKHNETSMTGGFIKSYIGFAPGFDMADDANEGQYPYQAKVSGVSSSIAGSLPVYSELHYSLEEVDEIAAGLSANGYPAVVFTGASATEDNFKKYAGDFDIIHLATHAFTGEEHPSLSGIVFCNKLLPDRNNNAEKAGFDMEPGRNDGILYLDEIYNLELNAELLVLSTCESGMGRLIKGEGIMAFTRGFIYAGAENIIFSLWKVNDLSTKEFMRLFYDYFVKTASFTRAMRKAKLDMINDESFSHPYYWSPFVLIGY